MRTAIGPLVGSIEQIPRAPPTTIYESFVILWAHRGRTCIIRMTYIFKTCQISPIAQTTKLIMWHAALHLIRLMRCCATGDGQPFTAPARLIYTRQALGDSDRGDITPTYVQGTDRSDCGGSNHSWVILSTLSKKLISELSSCWTAGTRAQNGAGEQGR